MAVNNFRFNLDIEREDCLQKFKVKQYDTAIFYVNLFKNSVPFPIANETIKMFVKKSDGTIVYQEDNITIENSQIKINVKNQALTASGLTYAELELKSNTGQVTTATFVFEVKEKIGSDKAIESVTDIATLEKLDRYVADAKKELERFKNDLSKIEDLVANKDKLEGQNTEAKVNITELNKVLEQANNIVSDEGKKVVGNNVVSESINGYIQDIKLYGKSLVNLNTIDTTREIILNDSKRTADFTLLKTIPSNTDIRIFINITSRIVGNHPLKINFVDSSNQNHYYELTWGAYNQIVDFKLSHDCKKVVVYLSADVFISNPSAEIKFKELGVYDSLMVNSYFKGIASVGTGVDKIEVSSCNENKFSYSSYAPNAYRYMLSKQLYTEKILNNTNKKITIAIGKNNSWLKDFDIQPYTICVLEKVLSVDEYCYVVYGNDLINEDNVMSKIIISNDIKQDTKPLLYKDTDGTWKKPLLREWDTIEQHSNGKYYYHKRSFKLVLNGSQDTYLGTVIEDTTSFAIKIPKTAPLNSIDAICDKTSVNLECYAQAVEGLFCSANDIALRLKSSKAGDVLNCKDYLRRFPFTLIYKMDQEEVYECLDISVRSFRDETMLAVNSGPINPGVEYYLPVSFVAADNSISSKLENTDSELIKLMFDYLAHNHDSRYYTQSQTNERYLRKYVGDVTDFNNCLTEGCYFVSSASSIVNAPYTDPNGIYGTLEVLSKKTEYIQRFTNSNREMYIRFRNYQGSWNNWVKQINMLDFTSSKSENGYQMFPGGFIIQWGRQNVTLNNEWAKGGSIKFPLAFENIFSVQAIVVDSNFDDPVHGKVTVRRNTGGACTQLPFTVVDSRGGAKTGVYAFDWIAIGLV
jgi:hypothetical protein